MQNVRFPFQNSRNITFNNFVLVRLFPKVFFVSPLNTLDFGLVFFKLWIDFIHFLIRFSAQKMGAKSSYILICVLWIWFQSSDVDEEDNNVHPLKLIELETALSFLTFSMSIETNSMFAASVRKSVTKSGTQKHDD